MASYNRVILMGNMTRDPQLRYLPSNTAVCEFGLAVNRKWRDRDGNQKDEVCFVDIAAFGRQAETINQYMTKGRPILVEGHLKLDSWTGQDGQKRSKHTVVVDTFQFVGSRGDQQGSGDGAHERGAPQARPNYSDSAPQARPSYSDSAPPPAGIPQDAPPPAGDDIPF